MEQLRAAVAAEHLSMEQAALAGLAESLLPLGS
jgi:hypothetical protein